MNYFGTDGVRGIANSELTCEVAFALGQAATEILGKRLVIGRDTRRSGTMLEAALTAGITSTGGDVLLAGIVPTPAVAFLTRALGADGGVVISASHNAPEYNGVKFFDDEGFKLSGELEKAFEQRLVLAVGSKDEQLNLGEAATSGSLAGGSTGELSPAAMAGTAAARQAKSAKAAIAKKAKRLPTGGAIGTAERIRNPSARYAIYAVNCMRRLHFDLTGLKIALDCAHGASYQTSPDTLRRLGADVAAINATFTGDDINVRSGSTHLDPLVVSKVGADIGIAHDGDADRVLVVSSSGAILDGDAILAILACDLKQQGLLAGDTVVSTVMANFGFMRAMEERGIAVKQTDVGDSNVLKAMQEGGYVLGGEQSGHIIISEYNSTGDGLITALMLLAVMRRTGKSLDELATVMTTYPQVLINVGNVDKDRLEKAAPLWEMVKLAEAELQAFGSGRVVLRASGTEPVVRVMVQASTEALAKATAEKLAAQVSEQLKVQH